MSAPDGSRMSGAAQATPIFAAPLLRLSSNAMRLELNVTAPLLRMTRPDIMAVVRTECAQLGIVIEPTFEQLSTCLMAAQLDHWAVLLVGTDPVASIDSYVELLVKVAVSTAITTGRVAVRAGTPLARLHPGVPGTPGSTLTGTMLPVRPPKSARLPHGANTSIEADGCTLLASCDGEVVLRGLHIEVVPMQVYDGDLPPGSSVSSELPIFIGGSVTEGCMIDATEEIFVQGDVIESQLRSRASRVTVLGAVSGSAQHFCQIEAKTEIAIHHARLARFIAGSHIQLQSTAWQCSIETQGNLYLQQSIEESLQNTRATVDGAVVPLIESRPYTREPVFDRQHVRAPCTVPASVALHDPTGRITFHRCVILDISAGGARCWLQDDEFRPARGAVLQLKATLPESSYQLLALARVVWVYRATTIGLCFLQISQDTQERLTMFCLRALRVLPSTQVATREQRGSGHHNRKPREPGQGRSDTPAE